MRGAIPPFPQYVFTAWCLVKHRDNFTFLLYKHVTVASFEAFTVMFQVEVLWFVTPCSVVVGYRRFEGPYCFHAPL
jgi:hypothetical protein